MKTGFPCDNILAEKVCPAFIPGETYNENRVSLLNPCMGLQYTLFSKMMQRTPWFNPRTCNTANTANTYMFDKTELPYVWWCINSSSVFHHGFLIDRLITIWPLNKKFKIASTECLNTYLYPPEIIKWVQYVQNKKLYEYLYFFIA